MGASSDSPLAGSSPPAWGAQSPDPLDEDRQGIIPTCVGSTGCSALVSVDGLDHPHLRGEHY